MPRAWGEAVRASRAGAHLPPYCRSPARGATREEVGVPQDPSSAGKTRGECRSLRGGVLPRYCADELCLSEVWAVCLGWGFPLSVSLFLGRRGLKVCGLFPQKSWNSIAFPSCSQDKKFHVQFWGGNGDPQKAGRGGKAFSSVHGIPLGQSLSGWGPRELTGLFWGCWQSPDTSQPSSPAPSPGRMWGGLWGCGALLRAGSQRGAAPGDSGLRCHPLPV